LLPCCCTGRCGGCFRPAFDGLSSGSCPGVGHATAGAARDGAGGAGAALPSAQAASSAS
jgi:hypothetical protein